MPHHYHSKWNSTRGRPNRAISELAKNCAFETGPKGPKLEGEQVEKKSKAAQTKYKKLVRCTCLSGHGCGDSGPKWHAPPCSEGAAQKKSFTPAEEGTTTKSRRLPRRTQAPKGRNWKASTKEYNMCMR